VRSQQVDIGRSFVVVFDHGDDFFAALAEFCRANNVRHGIISTFIAGFSQVEVVGTCAKLDNPQAPVWSAVHLSNVEALGGGTLAYDATADSIQPHIHITVGLKAHSATGHTSHLLAATVQFLTEMIIVEVTEPAMTRRPRQDLYNVPLLHFGP
jgi:predicted DNA-binding protein with PD1-like motif